MNSRTRQFRLMTFSVLCCLSAFSQAQEAVQPQVPGQIQPLNTNQTPGSPRLDFTDGVIVLEDGRVFSGRISNVAGGYRIDNNGTYGIVPFGKVYVTARTLNEAYIALRDRTPNPKTDDHLVLAEWCLTNDLVGQARTEVSKALKLEPLRPESRALMVKIEEKLNPVKKQVQLPSGPAMTMDGFLRPRERTSAGLSRETHQKYIRHIQPLIHNKCGNAYCHGQAAKNEFHLEAIRQGSLGNRLQSQSNLENVLQQIDLKSPERSPFLTKAIAVDTHHQRIFLGPHGNDQHQVLKDWVTSVARDLTGSSKSNTIANAEEPGSQQEVIQQASAEMDSQESTATEPTATQTTTTTPRRESIRLQDLLNQSQPDPFDPDVFNRRVHGGTAKELREGKTSEQPKPNSQTTSQTLPIITP
ncbi:hypothetical protein [Thalassoglobus polymorphus]|uniref:Secreted protein n=1 Tax=Thalassoglobus polymorphus TaxID=2527994 RepID=A0A517QHF3_9PLAN|nr:hypothetical protein [Thalassoglobus polymorphus]QDT31064.1 hypothetical protein Mal48_02950 [Thalassoglobus polymorphus]